MTISVSSLDEKPKNAENFLERASVIGSSGLILGVIALLMIKKAQYRLWELRRKLNSSLNILNVRIYQLMIISLGFQALLNLYASVVIIAVDIDRHKHDNDPLFKEKSYSWITRKVWFSYLIESILDFIIMTTASAAYIFQICEWFSILYLIRYESK